MLVIVWQLLVGWWEWGLCAEVIKFMVNNVNHDLSKFYLPLEAAMQQFQYADL